MQKNFSLKRVALLSILGAISAGCQSLESVTKPFSEAIATNKMPNSEYYRLVEGSIYAAIPNSKRVCVVSADQVSSRQLDLNQISGFQPLEILNLELLASMTAILYG